MLKLIGNFDTINDVHEWINECAKIFKLHSINDLIKVDLTQLGWLSSAGCTVLVSTLDFLYRYYSLDILIP